MKPAEWASLAQEMQARWPSHQLSDATLAVWFDDVRDMPFEQARVAVRAFARDGREFCPTGGQIRAKVVELGRADYAHGAAWKLVNDALALYAPYEWDRFYSYLQKLSPAVAEAARRMTFETQGGYIKADESTVRAQFRDTYNAVVSEGQRDDVYAGLPDAGLRSLQRGPHKPAFAEIAEQGRDMRTLEGGV